MKEKEINDIVEFVEPHVPLLFPFFVFFILKFVITHVACHTSVEKVKIDKKKIIIAEGLNYMDQIFIFFNREAKFQYFKT